MQLGGGDTVLDSDRGSIACRSSGLKGLRGAVSGFNAVPCGFCSQAGSLKLRSGRDCFAKWHSSAGGALGANRKGTQAEEGEYSWSERWLDAVF